MSNEGIEDRTKLKLMIPSIKAESETQTIGQIIYKHTEQTNTEEMEQNQNMSIRKRRNLSKNRAQATRQREKTPEPGRSSVPHEDTTTSDDEEIKPTRTSREIEADNTYEEMKRLVSEQANSKDPIYDLNLEEVLEARAVAATERRRRSISPFALPEKSETNLIERKGSFIDPTNKLLSTMYALSPKDEDKNRRHSLTLESPRERITSASFSTPATASPKDKEFPYPLPKTPKKLEEIMYHDEIKDKKDSHEDIKIKTQSKMEKYSTPEEKSEKQIMSSIPKTPETPTANEIVTKVIQIERTPSKKLTQDSKPHVEIRERVVRTPTRKVTSDVKPTISKQQSSKQTKDEIQAKNPPVKPARRKSASRFGGKTSESEMSEDQVNQHSTDESGTRRKVVPTPRRFLKNKSPKAQRSQSLHRVEDIKIIDNVSTDMSQTSCEILELMKKARARSLSIPKDDPKLLPAYNKHLKKSDKTTSTNKRTRGISCPKTIQIISNKEILSGLTTNQRMNLESEKYSRQSSGYIDASQSEYTSSCYSSTPSENEYEFDLAERTGELTHKLNLLSREVPRSDASKILRQNVTPSVSQNEPSSVLRKRLNDNECKENKKVDITMNKVKEIYSQPPTHSNKPKTSIRSNWKVISNWRLFTNERNLEYEKLKLLRNRCVCEFLMLIFLCGLGGIMFKTFEGSFENAYKCKSRNVKRDFIESLWRGSHHLREEDWKSMARKKLYEFEDQLHIAHEAGITSYSGQRSWNFMNSFIYCFTLITTIGYGHIAPSTLSGRVATIIYAIIGIPLFLIILTDFGKLFTRIIKFFWAFIRRFYYTRSCRKVRNTVPVQEVMKGLNIVYDVVRRPSQIFNEEDIAENTDVEEPPTLQRKPSDVPPPLPPKPGTKRSLENVTEPETPAPSVFEIDDEFNLPISVAIFILVVYLVIGAIVYNIWEKWSFFEAFYFVFISMSTIGLGDFVPSDPMYMMGSIMYLVFGLALTSMCINVVQEKLSDTFRKASVKLGATIGLKVAEEDGSLVPITPPPTEMVPVHKSKTEEEWKSETNNDSKNR